MTTYHLRSASPAKTRADVVVVGVAVRQPARACGSPPGAEDVAEAYGRKLRPLLSTLGFTGKAGEVVKVPTGGTIASPLLVLVGLGEDAGHASPCAARPGVAARAISNAASVALALPADTPELVRAVTEGYVLGGYTFTTYKRRQPGRRQGRRARSRVLSPIARQQEAIAAFEEAQRGRAAVARRARLGQPARRRPHARRTFADAVRRGRQEAAAAAPR